MFEVPRFSETRESGATRYTLYIIDGPDGSYVGITSMSVEHRWKDHLSNARFGKKTLISESIRRHGIEEHDFSVIGQADFEESLEAEMLEMMAMDFFETIHPGGLNKRGGGSKRFQLELFWRERDEILEIH